MKYKEFVAWCNRRACDGFWGLDNAKTCIEIVRQVNALPFWRRERTWQKINSALCIEKKVVNPINRMIWEKCRREG